MCPLLQTAQPTSLGNAPPSEPCRRKTTPSFLHKQLEVFRDHQGEILRLRLALVERRPIARPQVETLEDAHRHEDGDGEPEHQRPGSPLLRRDKRVLRQAEILIGSGFRHYPRGEMQGGNQRGAYASVAISTATCNFYPLATVSGRTQNDKEPRIH